MIFQYNELLLAYVTMGVLLIVIPVVAAEAHLLVGQKQELFN